MVLVAGMLGIGILAHHLRADATPRTPSKMSAPLRPEHRFLAIRTEWRKEVCYLQTDRSVEVGGPRVVTPAEVGAAIKECTREESYYAAGEKLPRKMLEFHPSGYLKEETDFVGEEQFSRSLYPNGSIKTYRYHHGARLLQGYDLAPDGRVSVWLRDGEGEREMKDSGLSGFRVHRWFHGGWPLLEKRYRGRECVRIRLDAKGEEWGMLLVSPHSANLFLGDKLWSYDSDLRRCEFQSKDKPLNFSGWPDPEREKEAARFAACRKEFLGRYDKLLKEAGQSWEELGIDFIRLGKDWPK